jgi:hypothetical protein
MEYLSNNINSISLPLSKKIVPIKQHKIFSYKQYKWNTSPNVIEVRAWPINLLKFGCLVK